MFEFREKWAQKQDVKSEKVMKDEEIYAIARK